MFFSHSLMGCYYGNEVGGINNENALCSHDNPFQINFPFAFTRWCDADQEFR